MNEPATPSNARAEATEHRVSVLVGDRLCVSCGFNLHGQHVVREPRYGMLMVRCSECGTIASLQEFPILGKWTTRWAGMLAVIWLVAMLGLTLGTAGAIYGFTRGVTATTMRPVSQEITRRHTEWARQSQEAEAAKAREAAAAATLASLEAQTTAQQTILALTQVQAAGQTLSVEQLDALRSAALVLQQVTQAPPAAGPIPAYQNWYGDMWIDQKWWDSQDKKAIIAGTRRVVNADSVRLGAIASLVTLALGVIWGVVLVHARAPRRVLACLLVLAFVAMFWAVSGQSRTTTWMGGSPVIYVENLAQELAGTTPILVTALLAGVMLLVGMTVGRPLARLLIRLLLPPRMRGPLAILWTTDGLPPPSIR